jgi:1,3-beta-galactosyl-N-acetylhexosamine phosphorylase
MLKSVDAKIYATYYTTRKDNEWAKANPDEIQQVYIMTPFVTATSDTLSIHLLKGLYPEMLSVNSRDDISRWWEVIDRTTGQVVPFGQ